MVSTHGKVHLRHKNGVACGRTNPVPKWRTTDPAGVTCAACKKSLRMADAEIQSRTPARKH